MGASVRWSMGEAVQDGSLPWALLLGNVLGCALLGVLVVRGDVVRRELVGLGFCGGLTSMSGVALAVAIDLDTGSPADAAVLVAVALVSGVAAFAAAASLARRGAT